MVAALVLSYLILQVRMYLLLQWALYGQELITRVHGLGQILLPHLEDNLGTDLHQILQVLTWWLV
ncbi:MAG: hypothetical protein EBU84_17670 [Actinobacteria bacterium]|nr:hypothetical protein [Actinomycetota bacterium]